MDVEVKRKAVADAQLLRDLMLHPGMLLMREYADEVTRRKHDAWLLAPAEEAEKIRQEAKGLGLFFNMVKQRIILGDEVKRMEKAQAEDEKI